MQMGRVEHHNYGALVVYAKDDANAVKLDHSLSTELDDRLVSPGGVPFFTPNTVTSRPTISSSSMPSSSQFPTVTGSSGSHRIRTMETRFDSLVNEFNDYRRETNSSLHELIKSRSHVPRSDEDS
ncbi:hypothetical protein ACLOJK_004523 [Asimina triloba]